MHRTNNIVCFKKTSKEQKARVDVLNVVYFIKTARFRNDLIKKENIQY